MMTGISRVLITVLNMSLIAGYCIVVVIALRILLRRWPKIFSYMLWSVVFFRLLCPFSLSGSYSLIRINTNLIAQENVEEWNGYADTADLHTTGGEMPAQSGNENAAENFVMTEENAETAKQMTVEKALSIVSWVWLAGVVLLIGYSIKADYRMRRLLLQAIRIEGNIYEAYNIATPFVFGIMKPRIYLPVSLCEEERKYVLAHEKVHIARKDYLIKRIAYTAVCIHWFNPLVWLAFILLENDMEMSCDEAVLRKLGMENKREYSLSLLSLASKEPIFCSSPPAFGERSVKSRVRNILSYRPGKPWALVLAAAALVLVIAGLMFDPADKDAMSYPQAEEREKITALIESYAQAFCDRNGAAIAALYQDEETAIANGYDMLEKGGGEYTFGFSSPWPYSYRYVIDWENEKADIWYYAWTSDPHITVWKEEKYYIRDSGEYWMADGNLEYMDSISSKEEFDKAYRIQEEYQFVDYIENGFVDAIIYQRESGMSIVDNTIYENPVTAAAHILNLTGGEGEGGAKDDITGQSMVRYRFADGSEVMIPMIMQSVEGEKPIWIVDVAVWNAGAP